MRCFSAGEHWSLATLWVFLPGSQYGLLRAVSEMTPSPAYTVVQGSIRVRQGRVEVAPQTFCHCYANACARLCAASSGMQQVDYQGRLNRFWNKRFAGRLLPGSPSSDAPAFLTCVELAARHPDTGNRQPSKP